jgi:uncharacterized protein YjbI with pentapeptide repeats/uncharacterized RDD family membrane protein YckC
MTTPTVRRNNNQPSSSKNSGKPASLPLSTRRFFAWVTEISLVVVSGLVPFGVGTFINQKSDLSRVPLNPVLGATERLVTRPLALPVSYDTRNVSWPTNFLWTLGLLAPITLTAWQWFLLGKTGSTIPKRWFGVRVVTENATPPGVLAVIVREGVGRTAIPVTVAYYLWRFSPFFPQLALFVFLAVSMLIAEGMSFPSKLGRRGLHNKLIGAYTVDATKPMPPALLSGKMRGQTTIRNSEQWASQDEEAAIASIVISPESGREISLWRRMRRNPSLTMGAAAALSIIAVLSTLIATQVYIQTQQNQRAREERNGKQFEELEKRLKSNSNISLEERRSAILALGTLKDDQATKFLVNLLAGENNPVLLDSIQQSLVTVGLEAIPNLRSMNQFLLSELEAAGNNPTEQDLRQRRLHANQRAINKILAVYTGKVNDLDLSRIQLGQSGSPSTSFFGLVLDKADLWGATFRNANLSQASFKSSRFRGLGEDGRIDTYDDWIADFTNARLTGANFSDANLSRVLMNRADLSRANLNKANLSGTRLLSANLSSAQLMGADLRGAILENASLTGADLGAAKLNETDLFGARLGRAIAVGTQLSYANLTKTHWQEADLSDADLDHANLNEANFGAARLVNANLRSANLQDANLRNADLSVADLRGANLAGADFQGTILAPGRQDPSDQFVQTPSAGSKSALVKGVDFTQVKNLDPKQIAYICTQGGIHPRCP